MSPPLTIDNFTPLTQQSSHTYTQILLPQFNIGTVPNGGYVTTSFLHCAKQHMLQTHPSNPTKHPINIHLEFLRRTASGPATFTVKDIKLGRQISNLHLTLSQRRDPYDESSPWQVEVEGYITLTDLAHEKGLTHDTGHEILPRPVPTDLAKLAANNDDNYILRRRDPFAPFRRASLHCDMYLVRPEKRPSDSGALDKGGIADQWVRFRPLVPADGSELRDGEGVLGGTPNIMREIEEGKLVNVQGRWTNDALGYIVDIFPQVNERFVNREVEDAVLTSEDRVSDVQVQELAKGEDGQPKRTYWYPTLLLNIDVKKLLPAEGVDWLFVRVQAKSIRNGRLDLNLEVWDESGDLVALSTHAALIVDAERNTKRSAGHGKAKESKI